MNMNMDIEARLEGLGYNQDLDTQLLHKDAELRLVEPEGAEHCKACGDVMPHRTTNTLCRWCERALVKASLKRHARSITIRL